MIRFRAVLAAAPACLAAIIVALATACATAQPGPRKWAWCSTSPLGTHQFGAFLLANDEWNSSLPQTICGNSGSDWQATFNAPAGGAPALTYPDVGIDYTTSQPAVSSLNPGASTSWAENMNAHAGTSAETAFDIWLNDYGGRPGAKEVMIWVDTVGKTLTGGGAVQIAGPVTFCGQSWTLWQNQSNPSELIWYLPGNERSGSACTVQMLQWLQAHGYEKPSATLYQYQYGWEIYSTGGHNETFQMNAYSVSGLPAGN
jgi:Glycosyl hydrolase family 12